jgi:hypothetical protein
VAPQPERRPQNVPKPRAYPPGGGSGGRC